MKIWSRMGRKDEVVLGVDLGTTNSAVAVFRDDSAEVLTNDIDKRTTPSCVYVRDLERQVGEAALRLAASFPFNTVRNVKSVLGRTSVPKGEAPLGPVVTRDGAVKKSISIVIDNTEAAISLSPEEIAATLLLELKKAAEQHLQTEVSLAVLAVPSYFNASQRKAVMDAANLAGLRVPFIMNETTAAAMAYAHDRDGEEKTVLIVDVGGGGSSAAVVKVALNQVEVMAHSDVRLPGGEDFDDRMMQYLTQCIKRDLGAEALDPRDCEILRAQWTKAKEKLSRIPQATISIFLPGLGKEFRCDVKRADFEEECAEHFKSITDGLLATLKRAEVKPEQLGEVLLVGGSSRIPQLRSLVQELVKGKPLCKAVNPDEAVAKGAALMAAKRVELKQEVLSLETRIRMGNKEVIVPANTKLPREIPLVEDANIEILQKVGRGNAMARIFDSRLPSAHLLGIYHSGFVQFGNRIQGKIDCRLDGCLPSAVLRSLAKRMQRRQENERIESQRVESKNALEDLLRHVRGLEIPDDGFRNDLVALRDKCEKKLQWLNEYGNRQFAEYDNLRTEIADALNDYNAKREAERTRVEAREQLCRTLQEIPSNVKSVSGRNEPGDDRVVAAVVRLPAIEGRSSLCRTPAAKGLSLFISEVLLQLPREEVLNDKFDERVLKLHKRCTDRLAWTLDNPDASEEEYIRFRDKVSAAADEIHSDRQRHAADLRKAEVRKTFESRVQTTLQSTNIKEGPNNALYKSYCQDIEELCRDALGWLRSSRGSLADERELSDRLRVFETEAAGIHRNYGEQVAAEQRRAEAFRAAEQKVLQALNLKVLEGHPCYEEAEALKKSSRKHLSLLKHESDLSTEMLEKLIESIDTGFATLEQKRVEEEQKLMNWILTLEQELTDGLQEFDNDPLLVQLEKCCRRQLMERQPRPSLQVIGHALYAVRNVLGHLRQYRDSQQKRQEAASGAEAAYHEAYAVGSKLLSYLGFPVLRPPQPARQSLCSRVTWTPGVSTSSSEQAQSQFGDPEQPLPPPPQPAAKAVSSHAVWIVNERAQSQYQPMDFTSGDLGADKMEVDSEGLVHERANGHIRGLENAHMSNAETPRERPGCGQSEPCNGTKQSTRLPHTKVQSAADDLARAALEEARTAGCMALIVDREDEAGRDLLSLSVRLVRDSGDAVELPVLVRDARSFNGSPDELVRDTWARFEELCRSVSLDLGSCLEFLSASNCSPFGPAFVKLCKDRAREDVVVLTSTSVPLDERVVIACYERSIPKSSRAEIDELVKFFSEVNSWRQTPARGCKTCLVGLHGCCCSHPWRTYSSSVAFLMRNREKLASTPEVLLQCAPDVLLDMKQLMKETNFLVCLAAFGEVFSEIHKVSQLVVDFDMDFSEYWTGLSDCKRAFSSNSFTAQVKTAADKVTSKNESLRSLVRAIIEVAHTVVCAARTDFKFCNEILQCLVSEDNHPRGHSSKQVSSELVSFKRQHSRAISASPQRVLSRVNRSEFEKDYPALYKTVLRALTAPLLPPMGPRSDEQLRVGARRTTRTRADQVEAAVLVAARTPEGVDLSFDFQS
ncbi:uncharacterized protein LOC117641867 isoform X2 [Thrips palmi]|uniref:Uncharacterized protein LOC117641867 isoform X2 n=1 Tax=Thrips palmi TaxID=161013 RepID=A0A6P8Y765_THRPL|nr:uncharacterized protein LOC117641867 isoform X2 [Thrips palmi]